MTINITYFVHGTTIDNEKNLASGQADVELSELGLQQAKDLGKANQSEFDVIFCSDLKRAIDTAHLAFEDRAKIIIDKGLRECDYGQYTQKPKTWNNADYISVPYPQGESYQDVEVRIGDFLNMLKQEYKDKHIAIVAHQAPQLALDVIVKGKTWEQAIAEDWRKTGDWQPGWEYQIN